MNIKPDNAERAFSEALREKVHKHEEQQIESLNAYVEQCQPIEAAERALVARILEPFIRSLYKELNVSSRIGPRYWYNSSGLNPILRRNVLLSFSPGLFSRRKRFTLAVDFQNDTERIRVSCRFACRYLFRSLSLSEQWQGLRMSPTNNVYITPQATESDWEAAERFFAGEVSDKLLALIRSRIDAT